MNPEYACIMSKMVTPMHECITVHEVTLCVPFSLSIGCFFKKGKGLLPDDLAFLRVRPITVFQHLLAVLSS